MLGCCILQTSSSCSAEEDLLVTFSLLLFGREMIILREEIFAIICLR